MVNWWRLSHQNLIKQWGFEMTKMGEKKDNHAAIKRRAYNRLVVYLIVNRAEEKCEQCGSRGDFRGLSGHHIKHRSQGGEDTPENLQILCGKCHSLEHGILEK